MQSVHLVPANGRLGGAECFEPTTTFRGTVLLIHGGGWSSLDSSSLHGVALDLQEAGFGVLTANYRKIPRAPWPA